MPLYSGSDCMANCDVLRGAQVESVVQIEDRFGEPTGWVALTGSNGRESRHLRDLTGVGDNQEYLRTVQGCIGASACESCELQPYTMEAYVDRGQVERVSRRAKLGNIVSGRFKR